jgi:hypothetical protein
MLVVAAVLTVGVIASGAAMPATASAAAAAPCGSRLAGFHRPAFASDCPSYIGWGRISSEGAGSCVWMGCLRAMMTGPVTAWYWTGRSWHQTLIADGVHVYVYPYATGWTWVWQGGNWFAVSSKNVITGS